MELCLLGYLPRAKMASSFFPISPTLFFLWLKNGTNMKGNMSTVQTTYQTSMCFYSNLMFVSPILGTRKSPKPLLRGGSFYENGKQRGRNSIKFLKLLVNYRESA